MPEPVTEDELDRLALAAAAGDRAALDTVVVMVQGRVLSRCRRVLPNPADAEDAAQDALLLLTRRISSFEGRSRFTTWLYQLTSNSALDTYRRLKRRSTEPDLDLDLLAGRDRTSVLAGTRVDLLDALDLVSDTYAEPVMLRDVCQLDYSEIARLLAVPEGTVKSRIHEGRKQLQRHLAVRDS
jgi:RNA polymerase sigma-70 factor (ECF subfamily)